MKMLYIVRHAKSSWDEPQQDDFDRPLNDRGRKDGHKMGNRLGERGITPDLIISSPAVRALATARLLASALNYPENNIRQERSIYHGSMESLLDVIRKVGDKYEIVMMVGHNPGLTEFSNDLLRESIDNIPTTGVVAAKLKIDLWKDAAKGCGNLLFFDFPKNK
jgi:phosphohistidine phosphatase